MRKIVLTMLIALLAPMVPVTAQTYSTLWKQAEAAERKDQPQTQIQVLRQIESKAEKEKAYGQLLKAHLKQISVQADISPDSLKPAVARLELKAGRTKDAALKAVYDAVLYRAYSEGGSQLADDSKARAEKYRQEALARPEKLARVKAGSYAPFIISGADSRYFNDDLLSVVGYETHNYRPLADYYHKQGNRRATCLAGLALAQTMTTQPGEDYRKSRHIQRLDSLTKVFGDLDVAGEVAVERYNYMCQCSNVTVEDKIAYIHQALDRWGGWQRMGDLRNAERMLTQPTYSYTVDKGVMMPGRTQTVKLHGLRNLKSLTLRVYRTGLTGETELDPADAADYQKIRKNLTPLPEMTQTRTFVGNADYHLFADSLNLGPMAPGVYMLELETAPATRVCRQLYYVSDIKTLVLPLPGGHVRYAVVSATTGQPVKGATLRLQVGRRYGSDNHTTQTLRCDARGEATFTNHGKGDPFQVYAYTDADQAAPAFAPGGQYFSSTPSGRSEQTSVMTDRSIYRPGQTVRVAAVVYEYSDSLAGRALAGRQVKAVLRGANGKQLAEKTLTTDSYGTCSTDFTLPADGMNGSYTVSVNQMLCKFRVEAYKRPTFQIEFPKVNEKYQSGDTLLVKAKALTYAGVPVQGGKVKYRVDRRMAFWWMGYCNGKILPLRTSWTDGKLAEQETTTDDDGTFTVEIPLVMPDRGGDAFPMFYNFTVSADVTDQSGETRNAQMSVPLGTRATVLTTDIPDQVLADSLMHIGFQLRNAAGLNVSAPVRFRIDDDPQWLQASTSEPYSLTRPLASGRHRILAVCENDTVDRTFTVFGLDDRRPATGTREWFFCSASHFATNGRPVTVQVGSSDKDVHILYAIFSGDRTLESGTADVSDALINRKFTYKESYGNGIVLAYAWVKDGQTHTRTLTIRRPLPDDKLKMEWTTFRDRLTPGQKEEWTLKVTRTDGTPADAQLMATLYDKSLDQLAPHSWSFRAWRGLSLSYSNWRTAYSRSLNGFGDRTFNYFTVRNLDFSRFDLDGMNWRAGEEYCGPIYVQGLGSGPYKVLKARELASVAPIESAKYKSNAAADSRDDSESSAASAAPADDRQESVQLRENLNETAFFYPALQTDEKGQVTLKFTLPESLTTWRFMGLAHTRDVRYGQITAEAVASKEVMVQPNVPRFVRVGDRASVTARIFNTGGKDVAGTATMTLIDPETERTVYTQSVAFTAPKGQTATARFTYNPSGDQSLLICRVTASGRGFSDGEQHYLPVLPDRERVTVTVPFTQQSPGTRRVDIGKLFPKGSTQQKLTVEYTGNPAWMVVQALPALGDLREDNAIDQTALLYATTLGQVITGQSPRIKSVMEQWRRETDGQTSLQSRLRTNQELKDIVLTETPWVGADDREEEQKQRLADFFDPSVLQNRIQTAGTRLARLQNADGSWSWWKGMDGSTAMTLIVAESLVRLHAMAGQQPATDDMLFKAFGYLDKQMVKEVERMKREEKKGHPQYVDGYTQLHYLYLRALDSRKATAESKAAADYLVNLLPKSIKSQTIGGKAQTAIILAKHGQTARSLDYVKSLKEYSVYTEEMGRYYDTPRAAYSWFSYKIPTQVAAIEAIRTVTPDDRQTVDEMRRWLLQEKRTQAWDTPIGSINAVYAFLFDQPKVLDARENVALAIDGRAIDTPKATAGLGYVKTTVDPRQGQTLTATKTSDGTSWGAVYAQFMQPSAEVETSGGVLNVKRELVWPKEGLQVGNRVKVRITVESKRDLDFVEIQERRAACMEPVNPLSGCHDGCYYSPKDNVTLYYINHLPKGKRVFEAEYYIDRPGSYETGTCTAACAYAPEYRATAKSVRMEVKK